MRLEIGCRTAFSSARRTSRRVYAPSPVETNSSATATPTPSVVLAAELRCRLSKGSASSKIVKNSITPRRTINIQLLINIAQCESPSASLIDRRGCLGRRVGTRLSSNIAANMKTGKVAATVLSSASDGSTRQKLLIATDSEGRRLGASAPARYPKCGESNIAPQRIASFHERPHSRAARPGSRHNRQAGAGSSSARVWRASQRHSAMELEL